MKNQKDLCNFLCNCPPGSCILLMCPPITEARLLGLKFIECGLQNKLPGLFVSLNDSPEILKEKALEYGFSKLEEQEKKGFLKWVDGYSAKAKLKIKDTTAIKRISGPVALSDMSIFLSNAAAAFKKKSKNYKIFFDSISVLTLYNSNDTIFRFLEVITAKIKTGKGIGLFMLVNDMHDGKFVTTVRQMMDGTVSLDDDLNLKILSFPRALDKKSFKLNLGKNGFSVD